jgi:hypothetical protein
MISFHIEIGMILCSENPIKLTNTGPAEERDRFLIARSLTIALAIDTIALFCGFGNEGIPACCNARSMLESE